MATMVVVVGCTPIVANVTFVGTCISTATTSAAAACCQKVVHRRTTTTTTTTTIAKIVNYNKRNISSSCSLNWPKKYIRQRQEYELQNKNSATIFHTLRSSSISILQSTSTREVSTISSASLSSSAAPSSSLLTESETFNSIAPSVIEEEEESQDDATTKNKVAPCGQVIPYGNTDDVGINECTTGTTASIHEPQYSVRRRVLVTSDSDDTTNNNNSTNKNDANFIMIKLNSINGKKMLIDSLINNTCKSYISLIEHYSNQNEPSYCGLTTFIIVCNALSIDPTVVRWKGIWRYFANESILFNLHPCLNKVYINTTGINLDQFYNLSICQGLYCTMKRPINSSFSISGPGNSNPGASNHGNPDSGISNTTNYVASRTGTTSSSQIQQQQQQQEEEEQEETDQLYSIEEFRSDIRKALCENYETDGSTDNNDTTGSSTSTSTIDEIIVISFNRKSLYQTGDGHFSPIGGYHESTDTVLLLDVARFKYQPYWVSIISLYNAMIPVDTTTNRSRGWFILSSSSNKSNKTITNKTTTKKNNYKHRSSTATNNVSQSNPATAVNHIHTTATTTPTTNATTPAGNTKHGCIKDDNSKRTKCYSSSINTSSGRNILNSWNSFIQSEDRIPIQFVPLATENYTNPCPIFTIKGMYCPNNNNNKNNNTKNT